MSDEHEIVQRLATVETDIRYIKEDMQDQTKKINEMHNLLQNARGVRWTILSVAGLAAFGASLAPLWNYFSGLIK